MEARAVQRHVRQSARKMRLVVDLIRGRPVPEAYAILRFSKKHAAIQIRKVLTSAVANAKQAADRQRRGCQGGDGGAAPQGEGQGAEEDQGRGGHGEASHHAQEERGQVTWDRKRIPTGSGSGSSSRGGRGTSPGAISPSSSRKTT